MRGALSRLDADSNPLAVVVKRRWLAGRSATERRVTPDGAADMGVMATPDFAKASNRIGLPSHSRQFRDGTIIGAANPHTDDMPPVVTHRPGIAIAIAGAGLIGDAPLLHPKRGNTPESVSEIFQMAASENSRSPSIRSGEERMPSPRRTAPRHRRARRKAVPDQPEKSLRHRARWQGPRFIGGKDKLDARPSEPTISAAGLTASKSLTAGR